MSASAAIATRETTADYLTNGLCVGCMKAGKSANKRFDSGVKIALIFVIGDLCGALSEPFTCGLFQDR
ncbi:MAG TPA: hypothetical protein VNH65_09310 [Candidatus Acidoferrum sp.]|nr:hypothetical protein [Candidatus Acidoferrum sp.]